MENPFFYSYKQDKPHTNNQCVGLVTWIRAYKLLLFKVLREHYWPWNHVWLGNSESIGFVWLPNQNQCHCLLNNTQYSCLRQLHTEHCNMTANGELSHFPTNPAEAVNKRELQWEKKPIIWSKGVLMAIRYTEIPLTPPLVLFKWLKLLSSYSFFCLQHLIPSIFSTFLPALFFFFVPG